MALFSRRKQSDSAADGRPESEEPGGTQSAGENDDAPVDQTADVGELEAEAEAASVGISVSTFRGVGAPAPSASAPASTPGDTGATQTRPARRMAPETAPESTETLPGLRDNTLLQAALANLSDPPQAEELLNVARQLLQGHVFLRVKGDARALLAEGKQLPLLVAHRGDKQLVLAYSGGEALRKSIAADGDSDTSAMGQPVLALLKYVLNGPYEGVVLDHGSAPARAVMPRPLLERAVGEADEQLRIKTLLAGTRTDETAAEVAKALAEAPMWIAVRPTAEGGPMGVAESRTSDGGRWLEVFSHPLELMAMGRGDQALPMRAEQLAKAIAADEGLSGVIVDPAGPWIRVGREQLAAALPAAG